MWRIIETNPRITKPVTDARLHFTSTRQFVTSLNATWAFISTFYDTCRNNLLKKVTASIRSQYQIFMFCKIVKTIWFLKAFYWNYGYLCDTKHFTHDIIRSLLIKTEILKAKTETTILNIESLPLTTTTAFIYLCVKIGIGFNSRCNF